MLLTRVRILDLSQYIPGPYITRMLADLGAEVIKVEPPAGDPMRNFSAHRGGRPDAYHALNHGKKIVRLDLKVARHSAKLKELLAGADVMIDGFRPGVLDRLGLGRETIKRINPGLIHCAVSGFGQTGPYSQRAGHDLGYCAAAGLLGPGDHHRGPVITFPPIADHVGALQAGHSILAALYSRTQTGRGIYIDASLYEPMLAWQYLARNEQIGGILGGQAAFYNIYQTRNGAFITLSALELKFWEQFCLAVDKPQWIDRHGDELPQHRLVAELSDFFSSVTQQRLDEMLKQADCCYEAIPGIEAVHDHPQSRYRALENHYPNLIDERKLASSSELTEITELQNIGWN